MVWETKMGANRLNLMVANSSILNPNPNCSIPVKPSRGDFILNGMASHGYNSIRMAFESLNHGFGLKIP